MIVGIGIAFLLPSCIHDEVKQPNVLFIAVDDLNDWIGFMAGHPNTKTPNIDKLASMGTLFTNAHCQAPICGPSRASLMTGLLPSTTGIYEWSMTIKSVSQIGPGQFQTWDKLMEPEEYSLGQTDTLLEDNSYRNSTANLIRNFLDCIRSQQTPWATLETGHRSTSLAHLATIAMQTKQRLQWDPVNERFTNSNEANKLLSYEYRKPWKL